LTTAERRRAIRAVVRYALLIDTANHAGALVSSQISFHLGRLSASTVCEDISMIIQTAPAGQPRLAIMMYEHTALSHQFARAFGNDRFQGPEPNDLMFHVVLHHDAGWAEFDRDPVTDQATGLPYNLVETPAEYITVTSRGSPEFNQRQHPFCGLMSSMHSWGLYNGRYGLSSMVLIDKIPPHDRPLAQRMLDGEIDRQKRLKAELAQDPKTLAWIADKRLFQNYKQLQFFDTLALYFNRTHPSERGEVKFEHVPLNGEQDTTIAVRPRGPGVYELSPNPFAAHLAEYAFAGRPIEPGQHEKNGGWSSVLAKAPTVWERFHLAAA
jgi:hypothetical protein